MDEKMTPEQLEAAAAEKRPAVVEVAAVEVEVMVVVEKQAVLDVLLLMILPVVVGEQVGGDGGGRLGEILGNNDDKIFPLIVLVDHQLEMHVYDNQ